jgi:hypothetical protein
MNQVKGHACFICKNVKAVYSGHNPVARCRSYVCEEHKLLVDNPHKLCTKDHCGGCQNTSCGLWHFLYEEVIGADGKMYVTRKRLELAVDEEVV